MVLNSKKTSIVMGIDTENVLEARYKTEYSCTSDVLTVKFKYGKPAADGAIRDQRIASLMRIVLLSDHVFVIHDASVRVFD